VNTPPIPLKLFFPHTAFYIGSHAHTSQQNGVAKGSIDMSLRKA
jgi:hypothetical protein